MSGSKLVNIDFSMAIQIINFLILVIIFWRGFAKKIGRKAIKKYILKFLE